MDTKRHNEKLPVPSLTLPEKPFWAIGGIAILCLHGLLIYLSKHFAYGDSENVELVPVAASLMAASGVVYLFVSRGAGSSICSKNLFIWIMAVGAALRAMTFFSTPIMEDDFYRYLWDGAVFARGYNPFKWSPADVLRGGPGVPGEMISLGAASGNVIERINHPEIRTIYPPAAQGAFALAYSIKPFSMAAWRATLLIFDTAALLMLLLALKEAGLSSLLIVVYWWNPLFVKEIYNSGHMDVLVLPFIIGALLLSLKGRFVSSAASLALATGAKLWPVLLLPLVLRGRLAGGSPVTAAHGDAGMNKSARFGAILPSLLIFGALVAAMFYPVISAGLGGDSGFNSYGSYWEMNDALFMPFLWVAEALVKVLNISFVDGDKAARGAVFGIVVATVIWQSVKTPQAARKKSENAAIDLFNRCLVVVAVMFMFSPTQFPWYFIWMLPFLTVAPKTSLLLLTALLPAYYMRFYFSHYDREAFFDNWIVWLEYAPVWGLLAWEWRGGKAG